MRNVVLALLLLATFRNAGAHEIGTTRVDAKFPGDGTYVIEMRVDTESLLGRLEFAAGLPLSEPSDPARLAKLRALAPQFLAASEVRFDGVRVNPLFDITPVKSARPEDQEALVRLTGKVPGGAKSFQWGYSLLYSSYVLRVERAGTAEVTTEWLTADRLSTPVPLVGAAVVRKEIALRYLLLGFEHIIPKGIDHILFVLGLFLLSWRIKPVLAQVTAFTLAHTITLGLTIYGFVSLSPSIVEPLIALSIVYIAVENLTTQKLRPWRIGLVFAFGLLHGMGFAGVLGELGLPREHFALALVTFNIGVELGQLTVLVVAFAAVVSWARHRTWYRQAIVVPASLVIAAIGAFWTVQRLM